MVTATDWILEHYRSLCIVLLVVWGAYYAYSHPYSLGDPTTYVALIGAQLLVAAVFHYRRVFFLAVMISFLWAGLALPLKGLWGAARWPVLLCAAIVGLVLWVKEDRAHFGGMHLIALFCVVSAVTSALVSAFPRTAFLKSMSLALLFLYAVGGARLAILNRERQFTAALVTVCEVVSYGTAVLYFGARFEVFGNSNSLGAVAGVVLVPMAGWSVLAADSDRIRRRRLLALLVASALLVFSRSRAGLLSGLVAGAFLLLSMKRYRLFLRGSMIGVALIGLVGLWSPDLIWKTGESVNSDLIYKGHREKGLLGSRAAPWNATMATIREHPFFGGGFGTTQTGADSEVGVSTVTTTQGTTREHGNSYLALLEWMGLVGILPFFFLIIGVLLEVRAVSRYMLRTLDGSHPAVPLATMCLAGLIGATFEDWLFAVGYYLSVFLWSMVFCLIDMTRQPVQPVGWSDPGELLWNRTQVPVATGRRL